MVVSEERWLRRPPLYDFGKQGETKWTAVTCIYAGPANFITRSTRNMTLDTDSALANPLSLTGKVAIITVRMTS